MWPFVHICSHCCRGILAQPLEREGKLLKRKLSTSVNPGRMKIKKEKRRYTSMSNFHFLCISTCYHVGHMCFKMLIFGLNENYGSSFSLLV